ncbi:DsbA family protein [Caldovatus sp. SYSU G05006]|uniref:DsbA family protein n=2 Tax=Caldovatus aquaticus TaxID=2865671 RepID=A0ABS7F652_9PROT|nr:DsbA family protein [Caldovatus aquaticus]MBW8271095.1 DsbA family protein [Caldovatus aquaticus]
MRVAAAAALLLAAGAPARGQGGGPSFTPEQREEIVGILREALRRDPSILRDALIALEEAETRARGDRAREAIARHAEALFRDPADPVKGNPQGDVTLVEFFDVRCSFCRQLHPALEELLRRDRALRLVLKDLPILGPNSVLAARALLAAQRQGKYAELQDALLRLRGDTTEGVLRAQAERLGLDWARLRREMDDPAIQRRIEANLRLAQALGIEGTPALVIGEQVVPGAVDLPTLERLVAAAREAAAARR